MIVGNSSMKTEMYLVGYDENGNCIGVAQAPTDGISEPLKGGTSVAVDPEGYCIVAGQFKNTTWFGEDTLTSMGERDIFLAKYGPFYGLGTDDRKTEYNLHIYANPNTGTCNISIPTEFINEKNLTLQIFDQLGKLVQQAPVVIINGNIRLDIEARATGVYNAVLSNGIKSYSGRIIVM
jgi:hypothetical protein